MPKNTKNILISGGTSGIGQAIVREMLEHNYYVATFSRSLSNVNNLRGLYADAIKEKRLQVFIANVTDENALVNVIDKILRFWPTIDILVNNAGFGFYTDCDKVNMKKFQDMIDVNVKGVVLLTKLVIPIMKKNRNGHILNIASISGKRSFANGEFYSATKYAIIGYSEGIRNELKDFGIKVATICPGMVKTKFFSAEEIQRRKRLLNGRNPATMQPEDISRIVRFIIEESPNCNIQDVTIVPFAADQPLDNSAQISLGMT